MMFFFFFPLILPIGFFVLFFSYIIGNHLTRKRIVDEMMTSRSRDLQDGIIFPVRYSSERRFRKTWKLLPWEGAGCLVIRKHEIAFVGKLLKGGPVEFRFQRDDYIITWIGFSFWKNAAIHWFSIESNEGRHYFTSETGITIFGSKESTRRIFNEAIRMMEINGVRIA